MRSNSPNPSSNSWLPRVPILIFIAFKDFIVGSSWSSDDVAGDAPTMSPASTLNVLPSGFLSLKSFSALFR